MKRLFTLLLLMTTAVPCDAQEAPLPSPNGRAPAGAFVPPETPARPVQDTLHGVVLTDPYRWLEDKDDPEVEAWTRAQHEATLRTLDAAYPALPGLRDEIAAYVDRDVIGPIQVVADREFFTVQKKGEQQPKLYTRLGGQDVLLFDPEALDPSGKTAISGVAYTDDATKVAVGVQEAGAEISTYHVLDTRTGEPLAEPVEGLRGFTFTKSGGGAYITVGTQEMLERQEPLRTYLHTLGEPRSADVFLVQPDDAGNFASVWDAEHADVTFQMKGDFYSTHALTMRPLDADPTDDDEAVLLYSSEEFRAIPEAIGDKLYVYTNHEAPNFKLMVANLDAPTADDWRTLYPEQETVFENYVVTPDHLLIQDKKDIQSRILVHTLDGDFVRELELPELGNVSSMSYHRASNTLFVGLSTFTAPTKIYKIDASALEEWTLHYETDQPLDTSEIEGEVQFYTSKDGTRVPIMIVKKRGTELTGQNPTLLYGYGGFNIGMSPGFVGLNATFINRGGVYAIAAIRGGDEYGEAWHQAGMLANKQNTFDDFIAAAEYLIGEGYTTPQRLAILGGSNGGLLVGAAITQRPDLFAAAVCAVPLLDMVRYHRFLIARYWIPEYGSADDDESQFRTLLAYSPYHHVRTGVSLPTTLVTAGENDTRVDPLHAKKFVARVQSNEGQVNPFMLYMDYDSGHGSGKSTEQVIEDYDLRWRFLMNALGMNPAAAQDAG